MLSYIVYIFSKKQTQFGSLSDFKIVTTKHKKHWMDLSEISFNVGSPFGWQIKIKLY